MSTDDSKQALPLDLPVLTEVVSDDDLPTLTDIVDAPEAEAPAFELDPAVAAPLPQAVEITFELPPQLEAHLEALFMQRLLPRLEAAQRQAVALTWDELKDELPQLIHDALPPRT
ncbi:MAG: hypothetical protein KKF58_05115 [Gammaproteobacteria bacterium]|nr:hypothetical protein [Gammaproteobacteria bacterium]MBU1447675.1 hypothetical protein [Gammaproteobacteria bacterium]MDD2928393.1 hypothetical protein [Sideroxydans sp.]MDD5470525.1 hypothetical protein [Sideroxydans sp.]